MPHPEATRRLELLAPAGDPEALDAALEAGADAVYFGLTTLNARRRARNLRPDALPAAVARIHARRARAYLTLNTDIAERELGQAARLLELARQSGVDAVLVRDPALLLLRPLFPQLEFHLSTQAGAANRVDIAAARDLGLNRVVLARELTLDEVRVASAVPGIQTEVFVQGALCYCVSGRCLLSSWGGGRSGNRGLCTSPCRVPWRVGDSAPGQLLSMRDLSAMNRLGELAQAGVTAIKIEGRMKSATWVRDAVALYRRVLDGADPTELSADAERLGAYTGRQMTSGYLDGQRAHLTGAAGRDAEDDAPAEFESTPRVGIPGMPTGIPVGPASERDVLGVSQSELGPTQDAPQPRAVSAALNSEPEASEPACVPNAPPTYSLTIAATDAGIQCRCECAGQVREWTLPRTVIRRAAKSSTAAALLAELARADLQGFRLALAADADAPELSLATSTVRGIREQLSAFLHQRRREQAAPTVRLEIPDAVRRCLERAAPAAANSRALGEAPDRVRLGVDHAADFALRLPGLGVIVEGATARDVDRLLNAIPVARLVVALPPVVFEERLADVRDLVSACRDAGVTIEANTWGGGRLARESGLPWESGPGLAVLNSLAARALQAWGAAGVTLSVEADQQQLEDLCRACPAPASLLVYGRPALMVTRADVPAACLGRVFEDRRKIRMVPRYESGLALYRPLEPFSIRHCRNPDIRVAHLVADLVGVPDPVLEWQALNRPAEAGFSFNYNRTLS
jgi:putative protease